MKNGESGPHEKRPANPQDWIWTQKGKPSLLSKRREIALDSITQTQIEEKRCESRDPHWGD